MSFDEEENLLKRFYWVEEYNQKIELLTEYYKFHEDVPRIFHMPLAKIIHNFYDKKRRINYIKINKMLHGNSFVENIKIHDTDSSESH